VRSLKSEEKIAHLVALGNANGDRLNLVEADLLDDTEKWKPAVAGCTYVCHTASPFPIAHPKDEQELIKPAVEGTLTVLRATADETSVKRVVLTSSTAAIVSGWGLETKTKVFSEEDWSKEAKSSGYHKSKLLAERAAWDFVKNLPPERGLELVAINPSYIIGPLLSASGGDSSRTLVTRFLKNELPGVPNLHLPLIDVRDVATAHLRAMTYPGAAGNRYICCSSSYWMMDIAKILQKEFSPKGYKVTTFGIPKAAVWVVSWWDKDAESILPTLGVETNMTNEKIKKELGMEFREASESLIEMGNSLIEIGLVPLIMGKL